MSGSHMSGQMGMDRMVTPEEPRNALPHDAMPRSTPPTLLQHLAGQDPNAWQAPKVYFEADQDSVISDWQAPQEYFPPRTPKNNHMEQIVLRMEKHMMAELSSLNRKLDALTAHAGQTGSHTEWTKRRLPHSIGAKDPTSSMQALHGSDTLAKFRRNRSKIRAIGAIVAAGKRKSRENDSATNAGPDVPHATSGVSCEPVRTTSKQKNMFAPWDSEAGNRMKAIQKAIQQRSHKGCRHKLWQFTESPYSSKAAYIFAGISQVIVVSSVLVAFLQMSADSFKWHGPQIALEVLFGLELVTRFVCCPHQFGFMLNLSNMVDLVSVLPLAFRFGLCWAYCADDENILWALVPFLRLLKLMRRFEKLQLLLHAFELAFEALPSLLYTMAVLVLFFAELIYFVEPRDNIPNLPTAIWFTLVTMTTVGYGVVTPVSVAGYFIASAMIIVAALYMAIPLGIVGNAFSEVWSDRDRLLVMKRFREAFLQGGFTLQAFQDIFAIFDEDASGTLDIEEFGFMLKTMQMNISADRVGILYQILQNGEGYITLEALVNGLAPKGFALGLFKPGGSRSSLMLPSSSAVENSRQPFESV